MGGEVHASTKRTLVAQPCIEESEEMRSNEHSIEACWDATQSNEGSNRVEANRSPKAATRTRNGRLLSLVCLFFEPRLNGMVVKALF